VIVGHPVGRTAAALRALSPYAGFGTDVTAADGWVPFTDVPGRLEGWIGSVTAFHGDRRLAASLIGLGLASAAAHPAVASFVLDGRCPDPIAQNLAVRPDADGHLAETGVLGPGFAALTTAGEDAAIALADEDAVADWWAERAVASLAPLFDELHGRWRLARPAAWGAVADELAGSALWTAELGGRDVAAAWRLAGRFTDALARRAPVRVVRPWLYRVDAGPAAGRSHSVRGTCCLYYRSSESSGPRQDRYCNTCPLLDEPTRAERLSTLTAAG
jgi:hypothetical protein